MDAHSVDLDIRRVQVLLRINNILLTKWIEFQQLTPRPTPQNPPTPQQQDFLQHVMRRTHCNLTYLAMVNDRYQNPNYAAQSSQPAFPAILTPPPSIPELADLYTQLQQLFPQALMMLQKKAMLSRQQMLKQNASLQVPTQVLAPTPASGVNSPALQLRFSQQFTQGSPDLQQQLFQQSLFTNNINPQQILQQNQAMNQNQQSQAMSQNMTHQQMNQNNQQIQPNNDNFDFMKWQ
ncbi:hypothetical protein BABINDRAFT_165523 [Babjeviella inositovora NRRL Y-12698]|uniref:Uncharacterized protein n=1 Tax=Babjeviella inositovora NRRL Y-12698 TaxID=984486 RepID=A0A1E3QY40_9ASCO|nr:uncharacterized protein BABINDRAFT_165523 [Babjeviella inositovora NRRL Y-12698]ODQ82022.1 hypothetical protein BABINDRAFT_165523 [Babjeviella inositovora NRRL Y-12698]